MANTYTQNVFMAGITTAGDVQGLNTGKSDNGIPIYFELETQPQEFGVRAHLKKISDKISVQANNGMDSSFYAKEDDKDYKPILLTLNERVNIGKDVNLEGHFFTFKWQGNSDSSSPVFKGIYIDNITDEGTNE